MRELFIILLKGPNYIVGFIKSLLTERTFRVKLNDSFSETRKVSCYVPRDCVLWPLVFVIYVNDIPLSNSTNLLSSIC